jgi:PIN domain
MPQQRPELDYDAITIDTEVFDRAKYAFDHGLLKQLEQFRDNHVKLVLSEVVHREMLAHMTSIVRDTRAGVSSALRNARIEGIATEADATKALALASGERPDGMIAATKLIEFCERCGIGIIDSSLAPSKEITDRYFTRQPPFEETGNKKMEFPDAIALTSLEKWAELNDYHVLVVTRDGGWRKFCKSSGRLRHQDDLATALDLLQPHSHASRVLEELNNVVTFDIGTNELLKWIDSSIADFINNSEVDADANSRYYFEPDDVHAIYKSHEFHISGGEAAINLVRVSAEGAVLAIPIDVTFDVHAHFMLSMEDPIDKDEIKLPSQDHVLRDQVMQTEALITLKGDFSKGLTGIEACNLEIADKMGSFDFGELDSPWTARDEDYEDYRAGQENPWDDIESGDDE